MSFLLDTNIISETFRPRPDPGVMDWLAQAPEDQVYLSAVALAELRYGIERMPIGGRRDSLDAWMTGHLPSRFGERILIVNAGTADLWGVIMALGQARGRPISAMDAFIAATAQQHRLTLVTRNTSDFESVGVRLFNPWTDVA